MVLREKETRVLNSHIKAFYTAKKISCPCREQVLLWKIFLKIYGRCYIYFKIAHNLQEQAKKTVALLCNTANCKHDEAKGKLRGLHSKLNFTAHTVTYFVGSEPVSSRVKHKNHGKIQ